MADEFDYAEKDGKRYRSPKGANNWQEYGSSGGDKPNSTIGGELGYKATAKSATPEAAKGPRPTPPGPDASLGERAAYAKAVREWQAK